MVFTHKAGFQEGRFGAMRKGQAAVCPAYPHCQKEIGTC